MNASTVLILRNVLLSCGEAAITTTMFAYRFSWCGAGQDHLPLLLLLSITSLVYTLSLAHASNFPPLCSDDAEDADST